MIWRIVFTLSWTSVMAHTLMNATTRTSFEKQCQNWWLCDIFRFSLLEKMSIILYERRPTPLDQYYVCIQGLRRLSMCVHTLENSLSWHFFITYCWDMDSKFWKNLFLESDKKVRINSHWRPASNNLMK